MVSNHIYATFNFTAVNYNLKVFKRKTLRHLNCTFNINVDLLYLKQANWIPWSEMSSPPPSIQMMIHTDNPWLSSSKNKHFSGRVGLEAQLIEGEEISLPPSSSPAAPSTGVLLSPNTSPYNLPLERALPAAPQLAGKQLKRETCVIKLTGLLFLRNGLHGMAPSVPNQLMGQKSACGRQQLWELKLQLWGLQFPSSPSWWLWKHTFCRRHVAQGSAKSYIPGHRTLPGVKIFSYPSKFIQS